MTTVLYLYLRFISKFSLLIKFLLLPFAWLYGAVSEARLLFFRTGLLRSSRFDLPVINIGNLTTGGTGKSPHVEYLIRLLSPYFPVAVLSRGYKRKTEGFIFVTPEHNALDVGDEPLQFKKKFPNTAVAVGERRAYAIPQLLYLASNTKAVILDDAFQHHAVVPSLNILLTEFARPYFSDYLLPVGRLRERRIGAKRAEIIIVTKCPEAFSDTDKKIWLQKIRPLVYQSVFFSYYVYGVPYFIFAPHLQFELDSFTDVVLISGIARNDYLIQSLAQKVKSVTALTFEDHHLFNIDDLNELQRLYNNLEGRKKIILTTEKDAMRLYFHKTYVEKNQLPIFVLPIEVKFHDTFEQKFDDTIKKALLNFKI